LINLPLLFFPAVRAGPGYSVIANGFPSLTKLSQVLNLAGTHKGCLLFWRLANAEKGNDNV